MPPPPRSPVLPAYALTFYARAAGRVRMRFDLQNELGRLLCTYLKRRTGEQPTLEIAVAKFWAPVSVASPDPIFLLTLLLCRVMLASPFFGSHGGG